MSSTRSSKKPAPATVFSTKTGSPSSSAASSSSNTPVTPGTRNSTMHHVSSQNSVNSVGRNTSIRSPNTTGNLSATATPWHPTEASRSLWKTNPGFAMAPVFPASPVMRGTPSLESLPASAEKGMPTATSSEQVPLLGTDSNPSSSTGPTPTLCAVPPPTSEMSPAAFPADYSGGRFRSSKGSIDASDKGEEEDEVVMEIVKISDQNAKSEADIIALMIGAQSGVFHGSPHSSSSSGADTDDYNDMVDEMDRVHETLGTPATFHPSRIPGANLSGHTPIMRPGDFALGPAHPADGAAAAGGGGEGSATGEEGEDFHDYDTEFDDELDEAELDWVEQQLAEHSAKNNDPGLFLF